jgi:hypothetical protein
MALAPLLDVTVTSLSRSSLVPLPAQVRAELERLDAERRSLRTLLKLAVLAHGDDEMGDPEDA